MKPDRRVVDIYQKSKVGEPRLVGHVVRMDDVWKLPRGFRFDKERLRIDVVASCTLPMWDKFNDRIEDAIRKVECLSTSKGVK